MAQLLRRVAIGARRSVSTLASIVDASRDQRDACIDVEWLASTGAFLSLKSCRDDGRQSRYSYAFLRDNAPDEHTVHLGTNTIARVLLMNDFDPDVMQKCANFTCIKA